MPGFCSAKHMKTYSSWLTHEGQQTTGFTRAQKRYPEDSRIIAYRHAQAVQNQALPFIIKRGRGVSNCSRA